MTNDCLKVVYNNVADSDPGDKVVGTVYVVVFPQKMLRHQRERRE